MRTITTALAGYLWALGSWTAVPISLVQATAFSQRIPAADLEKYKVGHQGGVPCGSSQ